MKRPLFASLFFIFFLGQYLYSQTTLFSEDFEISPVTSIVNISSGTLLDGPSPCGFATRGTTADFNSSNVDFLNLQNSSFFLGLNPEAPCGGFYNASLYSDTMDFSGIDSIFFKCKYFKSTTLAWGPTELNFVFDNLSSQFTIDSEFSTTDSWDSVVVSLPIGMISPNVLFTINLGGGEGVAIDDIEIVAYSTPILFPQPTNFQFSYTYISTGGLGWGVCSDTVIYGPAYCSSFIWNTPDTSLTTASLAYYNLYIYDAFLLDTLLITSTTDTSFEISQGFIGEMWVTAIYTGPSGESVPSNTVVNDDLPISIEEELLKANINVFYNSNIKQLVIENAEKIENYKLFDINGKIIISGKTTSQQLM